MFKPKKSENPDFDLLAPLMELVNSLIVTLLPLDAARDKCPLESTDAVKFVISCFKLMDKGEIFVPKMPSVFIKDLIKSIYPTCKIKNIGIRPGEKIDEMLKTSKEKSSSRSKSSVEQSIINEIGK